MGASVSADKLDFEGAQFWAIFFILPIALGAMLIANSALHIEMIKKEIEEKNENEDKKPNGVQNFMYFMNAVIIIISTLLIGLSLYYGIYFVLPKRYKENIDNYFDSGKRKADKFKKESKSKADQEKHNALGTAASESEREANRLARQKILNERQ